MNLIVAIMLFFATACTPEDKPLTPATSAVGDITLTIGDQSFTAKMEQNSTAEAFRALLPLTLEMQELNGNEKYHYLSQSLPTNRTKVGTIHAGDIMLYGDNCVVVFYETWRQLRGGLLRDLHDLIPIHPHRPHHQSRRPQRSPWQWQSDYQFYHKK